MLAARRERIVSVAVALLDLSVFTVDKVLNLLVLRNALSAVFRVVLGAVPRDWLGAPFGLILPAVLVGVVYGVDVLCHMFRAGRAAGLPPPRPE